MKRFFLPLLSVLVVLTLLGAIPPAVGTVGILASATAWGMLSASVLCMGMTRNLHQNVESVNALFPSVQTASKTADVWIDTRDCDAAMFCFQTGAVVGAGLGIPVAREATSAAGAGAQNVVAGDLEGAFVATVQNQSQRVGYRGNFQFISVAYTHTSGTSVAVAGQIATGRYHLAPRPPIA